MTIETIKKLVALFNLFSLLAFTSYALYIDIEIGIVFLMMISASMSIAVEYQKFIQSRKNKK